MLAMPNEQPPLFTMQKSSWKTVVIGVVVATITVILRF